MKARWFVAVRRVLHIINEMISTESKQISCSAKVSSFSDEIVRFCSEMNVQ